MLSPTLIHLPRQRTEEEVALLTVVNRWRKFPWEPFLIGWCSAFHVITAVTLAFAPLDQVLTEGTRPVLEIASRQVWAVVFCAVGLAVAFVLRRRHDAAQWLIWLSVMFLGGMWLTAFGLAVLRGEGSAVGVVVWPFLYGPWAIVAFLSLGKR